MEEIEKFFDSPKRNSIIALMVWGISCILELINFFEIISTRNLTGAPIGLFEYFFWIVYYAELIAFLLYFTFILLRFYNKTKVEIKNINYVIGFLLVANFIYRIYRILSFNQINIGSVLSIVFSIITILYLFNILIKKVDIINKLINNKVFAITMAVYVSYCLYDLFIKPDPFLLYNTTEFSFHSVKEFFYYIRYLCIIPYFYNYYELLERRK